MDRAEIVFRQQDVRRNFLGVGGAGFLTAAGGAFPGKAADVLRDEIDACVKLPGLVAEAVGGTTGRMLALVVSLLVLSVVGLWAVATRQIWLIIICGLLGWSNFVQFTGRKPGASSPPRETPPQPPREI